MYIGVRALGFKAFKIKGSRGFLICEFTDLHNAFEKPSKLRRNRM